MAKPNRWRAGDKDGGDFWVGRRDEFEASEANVDMNLLFDVRVVCKAAPLCV